MDNDSLIFRHALLVAHSIDCSIVRLLDGLFYLI